VTMTTLPLNLSAIGQLLGGQCDRDLRAI